MLKRKTRKYVATFLTGLPTYYDIVRNGFAIQDKFSLNSVERGLVNAEGLNKHFDGADGSRTLAAGFKHRGGRVGWDGGCRDQNGGGGLGGSGSGKRDGKCRQPQ